MPISDEIRKRINASPETTYRIAKDAGVSWNTLKRFADGANIRSDHLDKLAAYFNLELVERKPRRK